MIIRYICMDGIHLQLQTWNWSNPEVGGANFINNWIDYNHIYYNVLNNVVTQYISHKLFRMATVRSESINAIFIANIKSFHHIITIIFLPVKHCIGS